jgi:hypothetical protein
LVYDLFFQQWYTFTNIAAIDSAVWQSKWVFLRADAEIRRETPDQYLDVDSPIITKFTLALMQFAQVQGFQRIFKLNVLGENRGTHGLKLEVGYDYRDYFEERFTVFPIRVRLSRNTLTDSELKMKEFELNVDKASGPASSACQSPHSPSARG